MVVFYQVGGLNLGSLGKGLVGGLAKGANIFFWGIGILIVLSIGAWMLFRWYKNITFYKTPVNLIILLENGTQKTRHDLRGGTFMDNGIRNFKIKIPKTKGAHVLGYMPDFSKADADGRIGFITSGDRTAWQQYESKWILTGNGKDKLGNDFEYNLVNIPVPRETKQATVNSIKAWRETIDKKKLTLGAMMIGGFIIMVIAHLISLFIQTKLKCGVD